MHVQPRLLRERPHVSPAIASAVAGRLPLGWLLLLAAVLAGSAALPHGAAWVVALVLIIALGVPHGALDGEVARAVLRPWLGRAWFPVFSLPYLSLSALVLLAWHFVPMATLAAFLAVSVWHFGEEDAGSGDLVQLVARGGLPIALPVLLHPAATAQVFAAAALLPFTSVPAWLGWASLAWVPFAVLGVAGLIRRRHWDVLMEMGLLAMAFAALPPLTAFALYFTGIHAPRHMTAMIHNPDRAPRVRTPGTAVLHALPLTVLTLLLGSALWRLYPGATPERLLTVTLQGLAALTLPHLVLTHARLPRAPGLVPGLVPLRAPRRRA